MDWNGMLFFSVRPGFPEGHAFWWTHTYCLLLICRHHVLEYRFCFTSATSMESNMQNMFPIASCILTFWQIVDWFGLLLHMRRMQGTPLKTSRHFITNCRKFLRRDVGNDALLSLAVILIHSGKVAAAVNFWVRCVMRSNFVLQMKRTIGHSAVAWVWNDALILYFVPRVCNFWILGLHMRLT